MIIFTFNTTNNIENIISFAILNETDLSITKIPFVKEFNSMYIDHNCTTQFNNPYGVTHDDNNIYISNLYNIASFDINTFEFKKMISKTGTDPLSPIYYYDNHIYRCDNPVNCISKINVNTFEETYIDIIKGAIIPELYHYNYYSEKNILNCNLMFLNNKNIHLACNYSMNLLSNDNDDLLEVYDKKMNSVSLIPSIKNIAHTNAQMKRWNMLIASKRGVTRADSFDNINNTGALNNIIDKRRIFKENDSPDNKEFVLNMETNSVEHVPRIFKDFTGFDTGGLKSNLIMVNDFGWYLCKQTATLKKIKGAEILSYELLDPEKYIVNGFTYNNNNLYIFAMDKMVAKLHSQKGTKDEYNIQSLNKPDTINSETISVMYTTPPLPPLLIIFNINTEKADSKIIDSDIFNSAMISCVDFI